MAPAGSARTAALAAGGVLFALYAVTLAPDVTFWDAGEFIGAIRTLGIPHPPGTPLYVLAANVWTRCLGLLPTAVAANLFSAACTASAGAIAASLVARWTGRTATGVLAALVAGTMSTVWLDATETEVYAASLLLSLVMLLVAERRAATREARWSVLLAYCIALAAPLHLSALVAAPAAIVLALHDEPARVRRREGAALAGSLVVAAGIGTASPLVVATGAAVLAIALGAWRDASPRIRLQVVAAVAIGVSALLVLLVRAQHDPAINQGNPATLQALVTVVGRRQYEVASLWPRQAPLWIQLGNLFEYADWQVALGLAPGVAPSWRRTPVTVAFALLALAGATAHRRAHLASWRATVVLLASASLGVVLYLNLKAGPSFGWGILPDSALHEARERDYFFALAFFTWGLWAGVGIIALAARVTTRRRAALLLAVAVAAMPAALNWRETDRRRQPLATAARTLATLLLESAPRRAVLFVGGDNDSYPAWYAQEVLRERRDVALVTIPLLRAEWYRDELARRDNLWPPGTKWQGEQAALDTIAARAHEAGRPVAVAVTVPATDRVALGDAWQLRGMVYVHDAGAGSAASRYPVPGPQAPVPGSQSPVPVSRSPFPGPAQSGTSLDLAATRRAAARIAAWGGAPVTSPRANAVLRHLECPALALRSWGEAPGREPPDSLLDSRCNLR